jgi:alpha-D-xyloside xylohydrolase
VKFIDGYWRIRDGVQLSSAAEAHDMTTDGRTMTVYAPVQQVRHRGDTLNRPLLTVTICAPRPDVIRVRVTHLAGRADRTPTFTVHEDPTAPVEVVTDGERAVLTSGRLQARVHRGGGWRLEFAADDVVLTASEGRGTAMATTDDGVHHMLEQLTLGPGDHVYGLGERFTPFVRNGQVVDIWNEDGGTATWQAYKNIPFYLTDAGYGVFVNDPGNVSFEVASETVSRVQFSVEGHELDYYVIYGPSPKEILEKYTALTGRPALVPAWSFGLWLSTSFTTSYDEETVSRFVDGMAERDLPLSVFHFDCFWMREFHWCDFEWDPATFPDPEGMLARLRERGLRICVWINPYIAQRSTLFTEGKEKGYLLHATDGRTWQWDRWQAGMGIVDFTNPDARQWYADQLRRLVDLGVDAFKTDFGERIPTDVVYADGSDPVRMHNYYTYLYNETVFDVLREKRGEREAVLFARSATAGTQQFPVHWGGDCESGYASMAESLRGGLSLGLSGFGYWSHDIGGFEGTPSPAVFKRWVAFGLLSSHSRLHGSSSYRVPWAFDEESVDVLRAFTRLKARLMPYLYGAAVEAHTRGIPMMRAMLLEFPDDPTCAQLDRQYLLGERLLVAPVLSDAGDVTYYVPEGRWTSLLSGEVVQGPRWVRERHGFDSLPLLVRPDSVIPVGDRSDGPDYAYPEGVMLRAYTLADGSHHTVHVPLPTGEPGASFILERRGRTVEAVLDGAAPGWTLQLVGVTDVDVVEHGRAEPAERGLLAVPDADRVVVTLPGD